MDTGSTFSNLSTPTPVLLDDLTDVVVSAGSACHAGRDEPSGVLTAMGLLTTKP